LNDNNSTPLDLFELGCHVWNSLGGLTLTAAPVTPQLRLGLQHYIGVSMGTLGQSLLLGADSEAAAILAVAMFDSPRVKLGADDVLDALGEAANMLAGKVGQLQRATDGLGLPEHLFVPYMEAYLRQADILEEAGACSDGRCIYIAITRNRKQFPAGNEEIKTCVF
jgi:hypothetical protein